MSLARLVFETLTDINAEKCRDHAHELFRALIKGDSTDPRIVALNSLLLEGSSEYQDERQAAQRSAA